MDVDAIFCNDIYVKASGSWGGAGVLGILAFSKVRAGEVDPARKTFAFWVMGKGK